MKYGFIRLLVGSQIALMGGLLTCFLLRPDVVAGPKGFSNYGVLAQTVVPYTLAFVLASTFVAATVRRLTPKSKNVARLKLALYVLAALYMATLLSTYPYHITLFLRTLHDLVGSALFLWQILLAGWLVTVSKGGINYALLATQLIGSLLALLSLIGITHFLSQAQALTILAFGGLLIRTSAHIIDNS